jgi:hypothetical protein
VGWTAGEVDEDGGFGFRLLQLASRGETKIAGEANAGAEGTDAEEVAAFDTVTGEGEGHDCRPWDGGSFKEGSGLGGKGMTNDQAPMTNVVDGTLFFHWSLVT